MGEVLLGAARVLHCSACHGTTFVVPAAVTAGEDGAQVRPVGRRLRAACRRVVLLFAPPAAAATEGAWIPCPW